MDRGVDLRPALLELAGEPIGIISVRSRGEVPTGSEQRFLETLFRDDGEAIAGTVPPDLSVRVRTSDPAEVPDCFESSGRRIVSTGLKNVIEKHHVPNTEFIPIKAITIAVAADPDTEWEDRVTLPDYWLMNCWNRLDTESYIDIARSELKWQKSFVAQRSPWITGWERLVLKREIEADLFGFANNLPCRRFVSEKLNAAVSAARLRAGIYAKPLLRRSTLN